MSEIPITFEKLLEHFPGVSKRGLKETARRHGIGSRICGKLFFNRSDIQKLMQATQCSQPISEAASGTVAGKRIRRSLETSDRALAEHYANQIETRILKESVLGKEATATFATACGRYFEDRPVPDGGDKMSAILAPIIKEIGTVKLRDITPVMVKGLARKLYPNAKPQSLNTLVLSPVSAVMNAAHQHGLCAPIKIKRFSAKDVRIARAIDREWLDQFMRHAEPHLAALALFQFTTGARPNEACALRPDQLDLEHGAALSDATKNGKRRIFYLDPEMVAILRNLPPVEVKEGRHVGELRVFG